MKTYWLSFAPKAGPTRVVLVDAENQWTARSRGHRMGFYRDGDQVLIIEIPPEEAEHRLPRDRELTEAELRGVEATSLGEEIDREAAGVDAALGRRG